MNTGGKYDSKAFKKSVGLNGVGTKAVNALSSHFMVYSVRDGEKVQVSFSQGNIVEELPIQKTDEQGARPTECWSQRPKVCEGSWFAVYDIWSRRMRSFRFHAERFPQDRGCGRGAAERWQEPRLGALRSRRSGLAH
jgi:DNA gyrase/topoisomerase IV subunit B